MKTFRIMAESSQSYDIEASDHISIDNIWLSEKSWFSPGRQVVIWEKEYPGNIKLFIA